MNLQPPTSTLFPYTTLFRSISADHWQLVFDHQPARNRPGGVEDQVADTVTEHRCLPVGLADDHPLRSEEHTSELQSRPHLVCRLLLEKKKQAQTHPTPPHSV